MSDNDKRQQLLVTLYLENNKELVFWRERNWATLKLVVGAYIALTGLSVFNGAPKALAFLVVALAIVSTLYLHKNFGRYQERRNIGARIEKALQLFDDGVFLSDDSLLPKPLGEPKAAILGSYSFILAIWLVAIAAVSAIMD